MVAHLAKRKQRPPSPGSSSGNGKACGVLADHPLPSLGQALAMHAIGVTDPVLFDGLLAQLVNVGTQGRTPDERGLNFVLAMIAPSSQRTN